LVEVLVACRQKRVVCVVSFGFGFGFVVVVVVVVVGFVVGVVVVGFVVVVVVVEGPKKEEVDHLVGVGHSVVEEDVEVLDRLCCR